VERELLAAFAAEGFAAVDDADFAPLRGLQR
jgi:hypothetical protein